MKHLKNLSEEGLSEDSIELRSHIIQTIYDGSLEEKFVFDDSNERDLPIPVFSSITPHSSISFLLHLMLMCGQYETELDLKECRTMRESLVKAKLIGPETDEESLRQYSDSLVKLAMDEVYTRQPISLQKLDNFCLVSKTLFDMVLLDDNVPNFELPPCILTELLDSKTAELKEVWEKTKSDHLNAIYDTLPTSMPIPSKEEVRICNRKRPVVWETSPLNAFVKSHRQSDRSYNEQNLAVGIGVRLLEKYCQQFGDAAVTFTKGEIIHGVPGSGKSHVISYLSLVALSMGLRLMTTALMGVRANAFGGIHLHRLLCLSTKTNTSAHRLAELSVDKLHQKRNIQMLHILLTMDVLVIDECGMLSAEQLSVLDLVLRRLRHVSTPFGGVLIFGTMDHAQFRAINGLPFLLSTHIITSFTLVGLRHSVRAAGDFWFQKLQDLTRICPNSLKRNEKAYKRKFRKLALKCLTFVSSWDNSIINHDVQRMYSRCKPAQEASNEYVDACKIQFLQEGKHFVVSNSDD